MHLIYTTLILAFLGILLPSDSFAQNDCDQCYYEVRHFSRIENHPVHGFWDVLKTHCIPVDFGKDFKVVADGTTSSKFEIRQIEQGCTFLRTDPRVDFIDENGVIIENPTMEEHGSIEITTMTATSVYFEYTHPTDLPPSDSLKRQIRIAIQDLGNEGYSMSAWLVINIYRHPVLLVHGLWANAESFEAMADDFAGAQYEEHMLLSASYESTNGDAFTTNADVVPTGIDFLVNRCQNYALSAGKVNLVGHSMGGILSRLYLQGAYRNDVYRLITCNTPHSGSQFANYLLDPYWWPQNLEVCTLLGAFSMPCYNGAVRDLCVDSAAIANLNSGAHPSEVGVHALMTTEENIVSLSTQVQALSKNVLVAWLLRLSNNCGIELFDTLFNEDVHDLVVAGESQKGGLTGSLVSSVADQMHVGSTGNPMVISQVKDLLNEDLGSSKFTTGGYIPPDLSYNNDLSCGPYIKGKEVSLSRVVDGLIFTPEPGQQMWEGGDSVHVSVSGPGIDTIVIVFELSAEAVLMQKQPGPEADFSFVIPEEQSGDAAIAAFGYSASGQLQDHVVDTMTINSAYVLTGLTVFPTVIALTVGDTAEFEVIGHYDDGIDRVLNGHSDLEFEFTTASARATSEDDILLLYPENDTLVVSMDSITSTVIKIFHTYNPAGPVIWFGGTGDWLDDNNWNTGYTPGPLNTAYFYSGECTIPSSIDAYARGIEMSEATLIVDGDLILEGSLTNGLKVDRSTLINNGTINISSPAQTGLWLNATSSDSAFIHNHGSIALQNCSDTYGVNISLYSYMLNDTCGTFTINQCGAVDALSISSGSSGFTLDNRGVLTVDGGPIVGGRVRNSGHLQVVHSTPDLYEGLRCYYLHNTPTGSMLIGNTSFAALNMSFSTDSVVNEGMILIDSTDHVGMRVATMLNNGTLEIRRVPNEAIDLEGNNFRFKNLTGGNVKLSNALNGIYTRNTGCQLINQGNIEIDSVNTGILTRFNSIVLNDTTGTITISHCTERGIDIADNSNTKLENHGKIEVSQTGGNGIHVSANSSVTNMPSGGMALHDITGSAIAAGSGTSTIFTNKGRVDVNLPIGGYAINHTRRFTNDTCGVLRTEKGISCAALNFINRGFMHLRNTDAHVFTGSNKFINSGWIEDLEGLLNPTTHVTNTGVLSQPVEYSGCSGATIMEFFLLGNLADYDVGNGFTDLILNDIAGTLDTMANTFTPLPNGVRSSEWFFQSENIPGGCIDTVAVKNQPVCPVNCTDDPYYWTGCADSDWNNIDNWNLGLIPSSTDTVTINGLPAGEIFPEIVTQETVGQIEIETGAILTVKTGGQLIVSD